MMLREPLTLDDSPAAAAPAEPYSAAWWESRTPEELREFVKGGFQAGALFDAAVQEVERRARALTRQARVVAAAEQARRKLVRRFILIGLGVLAVALVAAGIWEGIAG